MAKEEGNLHNQIITQWLEENRTRLLCYIRSKVNHSHAEDILQETLLKAIRGKFESGTNLSAWIYRIANNEIANYYRREPRQGTSVGNEILQETAIDRGSDPLERLVDNEEYAQFRECYESLTASQRIAIFGRLAGKKNTEIDREQGWTAGTADKQIHNAKQKLKSCMEAKQK